MMLTKMIARKEAIATAMPRTFQGLSRIDSLSGVVFVLLGIGSNVVVLDTVAVAVVL